MQIKKSFFTLLLLFSTLNLGAYPIVSESEKIRMGDVLTLYPDHRDPDKVYFFPNSSMIAKDSQNLPMFGLTTWGLNDTPVNPQNAGAWMTFTARLTSDPLQQQALKMYLADNPRKGLAVIPVKDATIGISSNGENKDKPFAPLIDEMSLSEYGGHAEDEIGFMGTLTYAGARVFKAAVKKPDIFKLYYCYSFDGAGPDMDAQIKVNFKRVYEYFYGKVNFRYKWWVKGSIVKEVEKLRQNGAVQITVNGGSAEDEIYVKSVAESIVKRLFQPELQAKPGNPGSSRRSWSFVSFKLYKKEVSELKTETWSMSRRQLVERDRCLPVNVKDIRQYYDILVSDA